MDLDRLSQILSCGSQPAHLKAGFSSLLGLFPDSSCESIQMANFLIPLVLEILKPFYSQDTMVQINSYFFAQVLL